MSDVDITVGADTSSAQAGLASLRNASASVKGEMSSMFASAFTIGGITGIVSAAHALVENAHEIHHEADRFGLDAEQFQLIGNAAKQNGLDLNMTARAMNLLTINAQAALNPMSKQGQAMKDLGIDAKQFAQLNPADQFLTLADAYKNSAQDGATYADVATLIGKRNTEMIPLLAQGSAAIRDQSEAMGIMSDKTVANLEKMHVGIAVASSQLKVLGSTAVAALGDFDTWILKVRSGLIDVLTPSIYKATDAYKGLANVVGVGRTRENPATNEAMMPTMAPQTNIDDYYNKIAKVEDKETAAYEATLNKEQLLDQKIRERADLQGQLSDEVENEGDQTDRALELRGQIADITKEMVPMEKQVADEAQRKADSDAKWLEDANKATAAEQGNLQVMRLRAMGENDLADALQLQLSYQEKINAAYADGNTELAETLAAEESLALQMKQEEATLKNQMALRGGQIGVDQLGRPVGKNDISIASMASMGIGMASTAMGLALMEAGGNMNSDKYRKAYQRYAAMEQLQRVTGKDPFSFIDRANAQHAIDAYFAKQGDTAQAAAVLSQKQETEYWQAIAAGRPPPPNNPFTAKYGVNPYNQTQIPTISSSGYGMGSMPGGNLYGPQTGSGIMSTKLLQNISSTLMNINKNLTPTPGY
jgi:hypothetical protein